MRTLIGTAKKRVIPLLGTSVLLTGSIGACVLLTGGHGASVRLMADTANAAACPTAPATQLAGTGCDIPGTLTLGGGVLDLTAPPAVGWAPTITGTDQLLADPTAADETYTVDDATGTATGWSVSASSTPFATVGGTVLTLGTGTTTPTFSTDGGLALVAGAVPTTAPSAACAGTTVCTVGTNSLVGTYPVTITAGPAGTATPVDIYTAPAPIAGAESGVGTIVIGGSTAAEPVGWWVNVPSNTLVGTYLATVTLEVVATV